MSEVNLLFLCKQGYIDSIDSSLFMVSSVAKYLLLPNAAIDTARCGKIVSLKLLYREPSIVVGAYSSRS